MPWHEIQGGYRQLIVRQRDIASIEAGIMEFWSLFAEYIMAEVAPSEWDYLFIDVRGIDEHFGVYPQRLISPPFRVPWASLAIYQMGYDYREAIDNDQDGTKATEVDTHYAGLMYAGAQRVNLAKLLRRSDAVLLRFVPYAEDKSQPLLERYLMPR
jgi:hypothetical protein